MFLKSKKDKEGMDNNIAKRTEKVTVWKPEKKMSEIKEVISCVKSY